LEEPPAGAPQSAPRKRRPGHALPITTLSTTETSPLSAPTAGAPLAPNRGPTMQLRAEEISEIIKKQIASYDKTVDVMETGSVLTVGDGIARIYGLESAMARRRVEFGGGLLGMVVNLDEYNVGVAILGSDREVREGDTVKRTGRIFDVPVGEALLGRVVNALGEPVDGKGPIESKERRRVELKAPGIIQRQPVKEP